MDDVGMIYPPKIQGTEWEDRQWEYDSYSDDKYGYALWNKAEAEKLAQDKNGVIYTCITSTSDDDDDSSDSQIYYLGLLLKKDLKKGHDLRGYYIVR